MYFYVQIVDFWKEALILSSLHHLDCISFYGIVCDGPNGSLAAVKQHTLVSGGVRGTLPWMAPELLSGKSHMVSKKIDVYSFRIVMWELLTRDEPYGDMHCASIIGTFLHTHHISLSDSVDWTAMDNKQQKRQKIFLGCGKCSGGYNLGDREQLITSNNPTWCDSEWKALMGSCWSADPTEKPFKFRENIDIAYLLLYVYDIILTTYSSTFLQKLISSLHGEFAMTNLGSHSYFLCVFAQSYSASLFLSHNTYVEELLERAHKQKYNPCRTLIDTDSKFGRNGDLESNPTTLYHSLAGALQYLTCTRHGLSYYVQWVCLYMRNLWEPHFSTLNCILQYVWGIINYGLELHVCTNAQLTAYTNANWAGFPFTWRSTSGHCAFLGYNMLFNWQKKVTVVAQSALSTHSNTKIS
ncbi:ribonuclease H-like domain-containing protein [Tanacetum coccineum]